jgi:predicted transcriptional regulator YheO
MRRRRSVDRGNEVCGGGDHLRNSQQGERGRGVFSVLKDVGLALRALLGEGCEVVIHDTSDLERSIVWIDGDVTGRSVGDVMTDGGLEWLRQGKTESLFSYATCGESERTLKNACLKVRDSNGEVCGVFSIVLDVTPLMLLREFTGHLTPDYSRPELGEEFVADLGDMIDIIIAECEYRIGAAANEMDRSQRIEVVRILERRGAFQVRNSVAMVADSLNVTRKTIYNYLREITGEQEAVAGNA